MGKYIGCNPDIIGAAKDKEIQALREALEQALRYIERDETAHGRQFGTGNAIRAALNGRFDEQRFRELVAAYTRGAEWMHENNDTDYISKAANDYADYITSPLREIDRDEPAAVER